MPMFYCIDAMMTINLLPACAEASAGKPLLSSVSTLHLTIMSLRNVANCLNHGFDTDFYFSRISF